MSTCRGALPPHDNCPHGPTCDWQSDFGTVDPDPHGSSFACDTGLHPRCKGCSCSCHRVRDLFARSGGSA